MFKVADVWSESEGLNLNFWIAEGRIVGSDEIFGFFLSGKTSEETVIVETNLFLAFSPSFVDTNLVAFGNSPPGLWRSEKNNNKTNFKDIHFL